MRSRATTSSSRRTSPRSRATPNLQIIDRPAFNVAYVGFNIAKKPTDDVEVRKAIAHGLDRQAVVDNFYSGRGVVATQFMPPEVVGYADDVTTYEYDPEKAKQILQDAGYTLPVALEFWYPTDVSRPYMPDPKRNFEAFAASLNKSGFKVTPRSAPWNPDYLGRADAGNAGNLRLLGWTGDYGDADNFIGTFFQSPQKAWGTTTTPADGDPGPPQPGGDRDRRVRSARRSTRTRTGRSWSSSRASRMRTRSPLSPSPRA